MPRWDHTANWLTPAAGNWRDHSGNACNTSQLRGQVVAEMAIPQAMPHGQGGVFLSGIYVLTTKTRWTGPGGASGPTGNTESQTAYCVVSGNVVNAGLARNTEPYHKNLMLALNAGTNTFLETELCPTSNDTGSSLVEYTTTPTSLTVFGDGPETPNITRNFTRIE